MMRKKKTKQQQQQQQQQPLPPFGVKWLHDYRLDLAATDPACAYAGPLPFCLRIARRLVPPSDNPHAGCYAYLRRKKAEREGAGLIVEGCPTLNVDGWTSYGGLFPSQAAARNFGMAWIKDDGFRAALGLDVQSVDFSGAGWTQDFLREHFALYGEARLTATTTSAEKLDRYKVDRSKCG